MSNKTQTPATLYCSDLTTLNALVPDQNIYPQYVTANKKLFIYRRMDGVGGVGLGKRVYDEIDAPEAQIIT